LALDPTDVRSPAQAALDRNLHLVVQGSLPPVARDHLGEGDDGELRDHHDGGHDAGYDGARAVDVGAPVPSASANAHPVPDHPGPRQGEAQEDSHREQRDQRVGAAAKDRKSRVGGASGSDGSIADSRGNCSGRVTTVGLEKGVGGR
jgi:hypothetical protein